MGFVKRRKPNVRCVRSAAHGFAFTCAGLILRCSRLPAHRRLDGPHDHLCAVEPRARACYRLSRKLIGTFTSHSSPGLKRHCRSAFSAASSKILLPVLLMTLIEPTRPTFVTTSLNIPLPCIRFLRAASG